MKQKIKQFQAMALAGLMTLSLFAFMAVPDTAQAQGIFEGGIVNCGKNPGPGTPAAETEPCTIADFFGLIYLIVNFLISIAGLIAIMFIFWGAIQMLFSRGNPTQVQEAKSTIFNAILGLVLILLSYIIISYVAGLILPGGNSGNALQIFQGFSPVQ